MSAATAFLVLAVASLGAGADPGAIFTDRTAEVGVDFRHFNGMSGELYFVEMVGAGGALFDYDNDGDLDLYLIQGHMLGGKPLDKARVSEGMPKQPLQDRLYRNDLVVHDDGSRTLKFTDVTEEAGLEATGYGMGAATGDYDNDGWPDLYVTNFGPNQLWRNNGRGDDGRITFTDVTETADAGDTAWSIAAAFFDFDRDGWLDLYVGNYVSFTVIDNKNCPSATGERDYCGPLAYDPLPDRLLKSRGAGDDGRVTFEDVTVRAGLGEPSSGMGVATGDFNGDGWPDLYVTNDGRANQLWLNQLRLDQGGGDAAARDSAVRAFVDDALLAGCAFNLDGQPEASMGVAAGDIDGDGREDLLMTHLIHETNTLYLNRSKALEASFLDSTVKSGLGTPSWLYTGFGVALLDFDNDRWLDALVVNGAVQFFDQGRIKSKDSAGEKGRTLAQPNLLFHNRGGRFEDVTRRAGDVFRLSEVSRGVSYGDLDNDGDGDAVIHNNNGPVRILVNEVGHRNAWLGVRLLGGPGRPRDMLGAEVELRRADRVVRRRVRTAGSYSSASDPRVLFGLGSDRSPATVRVRWPSGEVEEWSEVPAGRYSTLREGEGRAVEK